MICHLFSPYSQAKRFAGTRQSLERSPSVQFQLCQVLTCFVALGHAAALLPLTHLYAADGACLHPGCSQRVLLRCNENEECEVLLHFFLCPAARFICLLQGHVFSRCDSENFSKIFKSGTWIFAQ